MRENEKLGSLNWIHGFSLKTDGIAAKAFPEGFDSATSAPRLQEERVSFRAHVGYLCGT